MATQQCLSPRGGVAGRVGLLLALITALIVLPGCASSITILQPGGATNGGAVAVSPQEHAVGVLAVDFEPPLDRYISYVDRPGLTLLAAVANEGLSDEHGIQVTARLMAPGLAGRTLMDETVVIDTLTAGEVRMVRFPAVSELPIRLDSYQLMVEVQPVPGQDDTSASSRRYDILIGASK